MKQSVIKDDEGQKKKVKEKQLFKDNNKKENERTFVTIYWCFSFKVMRVGADG